MIDQKERNEKLLAILRTRDHTPAMETRIKAVEARLGLASHFTPKKKKTRKVVQEVEIEEEVDDNGIP
jgi:BMFP domain-containing protein YqiC